MSYLIKNDVIVFILLLHIKVSTNDLFQNIGDKYHLVSEAYSITKKLFVQGRDNYDTLKNRSLHVMDTILDLARIMNEEMAKELRSAVVKFYKIKYFHDFTHYIISMEEIIDIIEHCLKDPEEKFEQIRTQFHNVIKNFRDSRNFEVVNKCYNELPDEVATAHCLLHQAVLFNETMQSSLIAIVEIKTRQHALDMNATLFGVRNCLNDFVPKFFDQLLIDAYTKDCGFLKIMNASISDLIKDKWKNFHETKFPKKWSPLVTILKDRSTPNQDTTRVPLFLTLIAANLSQHDIISTLYS